MNLIYSCVFGDKSYLKIFELLLKSLVLYGNINKNITYLVYCSFEFKNKIEELLNLFDINHFIECVEIEEIFDMAAYRLNIFSFNNINLFSKILYLDTDVLIIKDINEIFNMNIENKLYVKKEWSTKYVEHGSELFKENNPNVESFCSGVMFFNNCNEIRYLFSETIKHIDKDKKENNLKIIPTGLEQPYIVYNSIINNLYINESDINNYVNNYSSIKELLYTKNIIIHVIGNTGWGSYKQNTMKYLFENFLLHDNYKKLFKFTYDNNNLINLNFKWKDSTIIFNDEKTCTIENKKYNYEFHAENLIKLYFDNLSYLIKFYDDYNKFICIQNDFYLDVSSGIKI